jgi:hypothetical protein
MANEDEIAEVKWNYDAADKRLCFVHLTTVDGERLTLEIGHAWGDWTVKHRPTFKVKIHHD